MHDVKHITIFFFGAITGSLMVNAVFAQSSLAQKLAGRILLQVEANGEAWYVDPLDLNRYYLGRPEDAFKLMTEKGLGITNRDLESIPAGGSNIIDGYAIRVGDKVSNMSVTRVEFNHEEDARIQFSGKTTVTGTYYYSIYGDTYEYCFQDFDPPSLARIPQLTTDEYLRTFGFSVRLCFSNFEFAKKAFEGREQGRATIVIDEYTLYRYPTEVTDTAKLVDVIGIHN